MEGVLIMVIIDQGDRFGLDVYRLFEVSESIDARRKVNLVAPATAVLSLSSIQRYPPKDSHDNFLRRCG